jgi:hypothetical protein
LLDKVFMVQSLVGLEESVQLWLPSGTDGDQQLSLTSSEQLAEFIQIAEGMPPLQTKTKPPMEPEVCDHPGVRLTKGGNQHGKWVICLDCNARWKIPMSPTAKLKPKSAAVKKVKEEQVKEEPPSGAASSAAERFNLQRLEEQIRKKVGLEHQAQYADALKMMTCAVNEKSEQAEQIKTLKMELMQTQHNLRVTTLMADSYGAMAIGQDYQEYKGYHDSEMWTYSEKRLDNLEELQRCEALQQSLQHEEAASASQGSSMRKVKKDTSPMKSRASSRTRTGRHGYD